MVAAALMCACPAPAGADSMIFSFTGSPVQFAVPSGTTVIHASVSGARGGSGGTAVGGVGRIVSGDLPVSGLANLYVFVGGNGADGGSSVINTHPAGGAGGGGAGGSGFTRAGYSSGVAGGGGGGESDIRTSSNDLSSALIVAGGGAGGGGGQYAGTGGFADGAGGGGSAPNCTSSNGGGAGSATQGGANGGSGSGATDGSAGTGGNGGNGSAQFGGDGGGGGGGGAFGGGGGGGAEGVTPCGPGGGGGGGSLIAGSVINGQLGGYANSAGVTLDWMPASGNSNVVISQVFATWYNGSLYDHSFIELLNRTGSSIDLTGWAVQWAPLGNTGTWQTTPMPNGLSIAPHGYILVAENSVGAAQHPLPTPDVTGSIVMGRTSVLNQSDHNTAMVALTDNQTALSGSCPTRTADLIDFVGYGSLIDCFEGGGPAPQLQEGSLSAQRKGEGCLDGGDNQADFLSAAQPPVPRNSSNPAAACDSPINQTPPSLTGTPQPGDQLTCHPGSWQNKDPATPLVHQWVFSTDGGQSWNPITIGNPDGEQPYTVTSSDAANGLEIACQETAQNSSGVMVTATSNGLIAAPGPPTLSGPPSINGSPVVGQQIACDHGTWNNGALRYAYQWLRNGNPIANETAQSHTVTAADRETTLTCQVIASNDVGASILPATSTGVYAVQGIATNVSPPTLTLTSTGSRPTDKLATCNPGSWRDDPHDYTVRFQQEPAGNVVGSTGATHQVTVDDLGQYLSCTVFVHNAAGTAQLTSAKVLVPLPPANQDAHMDYLNGVNEFDPVSFMATDVKLQNDLAAQEKQRVQDALNSFLATCHARTDIPPGPPAQDPRTILDPTARDTAVCQVLLNTPADQIQVFPDGVRIESGQSQCIQGSHDPCAVLPIPMPPAQPNGSAPASAIPQEIIWDLNSAGHADAVCQGTSPVLRTIYDRGYYNVRAILVLPDSAQTGYYPSVTLSFDHFSPTSPRPSLVIPYYANGIASVRTASGASFNPGVQVKETSLYKLGVLRPAQPFACRTSLQPPPDPVLPCTQDAYIGQVHVEGNLCPISLRHMPPEELHTIQRNDPDLYAILQAQNLSNPLPARDVSRRGPPAHAAAFPTGAASAYTYSAEEFAAAVPQHFPLTGAVKKALTELNLSDLEAPFALDQVYISQGPMKVDGVNVTPTAGHSVVMVPSDVGQAVQSVGKMLISSSSAGLDLGGIPLSASTASNFQSSIDDAVNAAAQQFQSVNLDAIKSALLSKLDLGPFNLAGNATVKLANGVAILDAYAELPSLSTEPGGAPIRASVEITGQPDGTVKLNGIHLSVPDAYVGAVHVSNLDLTYDGGLTIRGQILIVDTGIDIKEFRIDDRGHFRALVLDYLAGAGQGIPVGPGIFLTKLGGGLTLDPDEIIADAALSVGPSAGGGCPIIGYDGTLTVHFSPPPFSIGANADIELVCLKLANVHFYATSDGYVTLGASMAFDAGPLYFHADLNGSLLLPNWQVEGSGSGGIRHVLSGTVKAIISNHGLAACGSVDVGPFTVSGGAGVTYNPSLILGPAAILANLHLFTGCDLSDYETVVAPREADAAAAGTRVFTVSPGQRLLALRVQGVGGAPRVALRGPGGVTFDLTGPAVSVRNAHGLAVRAPAEDRSFFLVAYPPAGVWRIVPAPGSPVIVAVQQSHLLPRAQVSAHVTGAGSSRVLHWHVVPLAGQVVRFVEQDDHGGKVLAIVHGGGSGSVRFMPAHARSTRRTIVAQVQQSGLPRISLIVARFSAANPAVGKPAFVRLRRSGTRVLVSWGAAALAQRYDVVVTFSTGKREVFSPRRGARRLTLTRVPRTAGVSAAVIGISATGIRGPAARAQLRAAKPPRRRPRH